MSNKVLVIWGSIIKSNESFSYELTQRFIKYYKINNPNDVINFLDLNETEVAKKTLTCKNFKDFFNDEDCNKYINQLKECNKLIISCPMTNFNVPTIVKNYLDHILIADKTFSYKYQKKGDAIGLLTNLKVQILTTQGAPKGWYSWGSTEKYLAGTWRFVGAKVMKPIVISGTKIPKNKNIEPPQLIDQYDKVIQKAARHF